MFDYALTESSPDRLVFTFPPPDTGGRVGRVIGWLLLAALVGGIGYGVWHIGQSPLPWHRHPATMVIGMLALFVSSGAFFGQNAPEPHTFTMDRATGLMQLRAADGSADIAWPLTDCREVVTSESGGSSSGAGESSTRWYHLTLVLRDGGQVRLLRTLHPETRDAAAAILRALLATAAQRPAADRPPLRLPPSLDVTRGPDGTLLRWRSSIEAASVGWLLVVAASTTLLATPLVSWTFAPGDRPPDTAGRVIVGGIVGLLAMLITVAAIRRLRIHGRRHALRIGRRGVSYDSQGGLLPARTHWEVPHERLVAVRFLWVAWMLEVLEGDPARVPAAHAAGETPPYDRRHMIRYGRLTVSQMIGVEQFLEAEVLRWRPGADAA